MKERERMLEAIKFGVPDRIPLTPGGGRESTRARWYSEGLPESVEPGRIVSYAYQQIGGKLELPVGGPGFPVDFRMIPTFEEKVIEKKENSQIVQDWKGNICEIGNEFDPSYLRNAIDFVTRRWIKCPVENRDDWENMKWRYNAADTARLPLNAEKLGAELRGRDHYLAWNFSGPFWQLREWCGFEGLCMLFIDDPEFVREMIEFWTAFVADLLERGMQYVVPDEVHLSEDMAYKSFSMISPAMTREFLMPAYLTWNQMLKAAGVPVFGMDSDGYIGELIPIWIESGINLCDPIEVAAGNDICLFRKEFGHKIAFRGGVDKRAMAKGGKFLEDEISRLRPIIKDGGYIPSCDHGIPSDVSWPNFLDYMRLLARETGWL